jgi:hypothetical protein
LFVAVGPLRKELSILKKVLFFDHPVSIREMTMAGDEIASFVVHIVLTLSTMRCRSTQGH